MRKKSSAITKEKFSLVPFGVQRRLYELVLHAISLREQRGLRDRVHTDFAEIGAITALNDSDPVFATPDTIGAHVVRGTDLKALETASSRQSDASKRAEDDKATTESLLTSVVTNLIEDPKRLAVVPTMDLSQPSWQKVLRFAGRHRLPILFIVPGRIASKRDTSTDLRTVYAEFGVPVMTVDANDSIAAYRVATEAAHNARAGRGATVLEAAIVQTPHAPVNSQHPLEHLEDYMRRKGSWDDRWRKEIELSTERQ